MTDTPEAARADARHPRAVTLRFQGPVNRLVRGLLALPLVSRAIGRRLVVVHVVGRSTGRRFAVPVAYTRHDGDLLIGTPFAWGRNLRTGEPVEVRYKGRRRWADVAAFTQEADVVSLYSVMAKDNRNFAAFNRIGFDAGGEPDSDDLHRAWTGGARAFRLTVR
jgi:hypothetical protein